MNVLKSLSSIIDMGIFAYLQSKKEIYLLKNSHLLFSIHYNNRKTKIYLQKKFGYVDLYIYTHGIYEKEIIDDIRKELSTEKVMLDIGGNIGQHSLLLSPYCKEIHAFEPIPEIFNEFQNSIKANNYKNIFVQNLAIGNKKEVKTIYYNVANAGASTLIENNSPGRKINVQIERLENTLPKNQKFDVVKIDVEGYEAVVILGNADIFLQNRPIFFMEFCPSLITDEGTHKPKNIVDFFFENNYKIYSQKLKKTFFEDSAEIYINDNWVVKPNK